MTNQLAQVLMLPNWLAAQAAASYPATVLSMSQSKMLQYLQLAEISGSTAVDSSNKGNNGALVTPKFVQRFFTNMTPALRFDGTATYINAYSAALAGAFNGDEGTVFLWVRLTDPANWTGTEKVIFSFNAGNANNAISISIAKGGSNQLTFTRVANGASKEVVASAQTDLYWMPIAITWSVSSDRLRAYIGGLQSGSDVTGLSAFVGSLASAGVNVGALSTTGARSNYFKGALAHFAVWTKELTAAQILTMSTAPGYSLSNQKVLYYDDFLEELASPMSNPLTDPVLGTAEETALIAGDRVLDLSPNNFAVQTAGVFKNITGGAASIFHNMHNGSSAQRWGPPQRHGIAFLFTQAWTSSRYQIGAVRDNNFAGNKINWDPVVEGTVAANLIGSGTNFYRALDIAASTYYDFALIVWDEGWLILKHADAGVWKIGWFYPKGTFAASDAQGISSYVTGVADAGGADRLRVSKVTGIQLPEPFDGGPWRTLSFYETSFPLAAAKQTDADALIQFEMTLPVSPVNGDKVGIRFNMAGPTDVDNCREFYVQFNGTNWDLKLDEIVATVRTSKGTAAAIAAASGLSVHCVGGAVKCFYKSGSTPYAGDSNRIINVTGLTATQSNTYCQPFYASGTTPVFFAGVPELSSDSKWDNILEPLFGR